MADKAITALTEDTALTDNDVLPIVDVESGTTKKTKLSTLLAYIVGKLFGTWTAWTPTVTPNSGAFTSVTPTGKYTQVGKTVQFRANILITTNGTAAGVRIAPPVAPVTGANFYVGSGREDNSTGKALQINYQNATGLFFINYYDNNAPNANNLLLLISGTYEAA